MTAPTTTPGTLTAALTARQVQLTVRAALLRDVALLWPLLNPKNVDASFPAWLQAMKLLLTNYHQQAATAAGRSYLQARVSVIEETAPRDLIKTAPTPPVEWLDRALGFAGPGMLNRDLARPNTALTTTLGTSSRIVLDGARTTVLNTVHHDDKAVGWYRVTDGHPCAFCALLASRGIVYKSTTVGFQAHNDCGCTGAPAFSRHQELPDISRRAAQVYTERGSGPAMKAFRRAWDDHLTQTG